MPIAFYCRARPQGCDAFDIFDQAGYVFIGYPLVRFEENNPQTLGDCLIHPCCPDTEWEEQTAGRRNRNFTKNRNFIPRVTNGSIVVIPRPSQGIFYLGRITGEFTIINAPNWGKDYLQLRMDQQLDANDDANHHIADVSQGWPVDEFRCRYFSRIPGWLRRSLFGRSTYSELPSHPLNQEVTAYSGNRGNLPGS